MKNKTSSIFTILCRLRDHGGDVNSHVSFFSSSTPFIYSFASHFSNVTFCTPPASPHTFAPPVFISQKPICIQMNFNDFGKKCLLFRPCI